MKTQKIVLALLVFGAIINVVGHATAMDTPIVKEDCNNPLISQTVAGDCDGVKGLKDHPRFRLR